MQGQGQVLYYVLMMWLSTDDLSQRCIEVVPDLLRAIQRRVLGNKFLMFFGYLSSEM